MAALVADLGRSRRCRRNVADETPTMKVEISYLASTGGRSLPKVAQKLLVFEDRYVTVEGAEGVYDYGGSVKAAVLRRE